MVYSLLIEHMDKKARDDLYSDLFRKPPGSTRAGGDGFDLALRQQAELYLKSLPPNFGQIDSKEDKGEA